MHVTEKNGEIAFENENVSLMNQGGETEELEIFETLSF